MRAVVDTTAVRSFLATAADVAAGGLDPTAGWAAYERRHPELFDRYFDGWGDPARRPAAAAGMVATAGRLTEAAVDWQGVLDDAANRLTMLLPEAVDVPVVVFVGMGTSNGWVTMLRGQPTVFLAAEFVPPAPLHIVLAGHELAHGVQQMLGLGWRASDYPLGALLLAEGVATYLSSLVHPRLGDDEYLWFDGRHGQWLQDCERVWAAAAPALLQVLDERCGGAAERRFFTNRSGLPDPVVPVRFGYYAGLRVARDLAATVGVATLLSSGVDAGARLARVGLESLV